MVRRPRPRRTRGDVRRPLPERPVTELTACRTLALRAALAEDPDVAFNAVLHAPVLRTFCGLQMHDPATCLEYFALQGRVIIGENGRSARSSGVTVRTP